MSRGHIRQRGENKHQIVVYVGRDPKTGKKVQQAQTIHGPRKEAEKALTAFLAAVDRGQVPTDRSTLADYLSRWLGVHRHSVEASAHKRYEELLRVHVVPSLGTRQLRKLKPFDIQRLYTDLAGKIENRTIQRVHRVLKQALSQAVAWEIIPGNPAQHVRPPRVQEPEPYVPDTDVLAAILRAATGKYCHEIFLVALYTGMRKGEILGLRWKDVDFEQRVLYVRQALEYSRGKAPRFKEPKTRAGRRQVALTPEAVQLLKAHRSRQLEVRLRAGRAYDDVLDLVFAGEDGKPLRESLVRSQWDRSCRDAKVKMRFHDLRHAHASFLLMQGVHPKVVSDRLGHSGIEVTMDIYSHVMAGLRHKAMEGFDDLMKKMAG